MPTTKVQDRRIPWYYLLFSATVLLIWAVAMEMESMWHLFAHHIPAMVTMMFGAFVAGSSPEGSAALAYPIFTLYLDIPPETARNFAFAIQSIGMTAASLMILHLRLSIEWTYFRYVTFSGFIGLLLGIFFIAPWIPAGFAKLFFVSLWLSFGIVLWTVNRRKTRIVSQHLPPLEISDKALLISLGIAGGILSSIFGTGINVLSFCAMVIFYRLNEKIAVPTSILIMTTEAIAGFLIHLWWLRDMQPQALELWMACIPVVLIFAPLGSWFLSKINRHHLANLLYFIFAIQYIGALYVLRPGWISTLISLTTIALGIGLFYFLYRQGTKKMATRN
jgi:uncharacterized protein